MRYNQALTKIRELGNKMSEHAETAEKASRTYSATMELYSIASAAGDEKTMQAYRDTLHTAVDIILDSSAMISKFQQEQKEIARQVTDWPTL